MRANDRAMKAAAFGLRHLADLLDDGWVPDSRTVKRLCGWGDVEDMLTVELPKGVFDAGS